MACVRGGLAGAELDTAGALVAATAQGVPPEAAVTLLRCFAAGMAAGRAEWKEGKPDGD